MNWYKTAQQITMNDEVVGSHSGQTDLRLNAKNEKGETIGHIDYTDFRGEIHIKYIEVLPAYRRQGVGTKLMKELQKGYPNVEINTGMLTEEGSQLYNSLQKQTIKNEPYEDYLKEKEEKSKRLAIVEKQLDEFYSAKEIDESRQPEFLALGDEWNKLYDRISDIDINLSVMAPSQTLIS